MHSALAIVAFVIPLGFDTLAVSIALGLRGVSPWRPALLFAAFETTMPLAGIALGRHVGARFESLAGYLGAIVVLAVGVHILREASEPGGELRPFSLRGVREVVAAGLGVSTDEIAIGFPLGALRLPVGAVLGAIGVQALLVTAGGIFIGHKIGNRLGEQAVRLSSVIAGSAFILLGAYLIVERVLRR
ncbi:MAG TPA: manganese efflux pump [bacterium]|nr:manganese efflux pump [bacterium]